MGSTNDFLLFDPFIVFVFVQHGRTKSVTSHRFTPLFMFIHLPLIHFAPPPRLLIDFKNGKWLTYFCILLYIIMHLLLFLPPDLLTFCHMIISFYLFSVSLWRRANARNVRLYYPYWQYTDLFTNNYNRLVCCRYDFPWRKVGVFLDFIVTLFLTINIKKM